MLKKTLSNIINNDYSFSVIAKVIGVLFSLVLSVLTARYFGPELKGVLAIIANDVSLYSVFLGLGIYIAYPFFKKQEGDIFKKYVNNISSLYLIYQAFAVIVSLSALFFQTNILTIVAIILLPISVYTKQLNYVVLIEHPKRRNTNSIIINISQLLLILVFLLCFSADKYIAIVYICFVQVVNLVLSFINLHVNPTTIRFDVSQLKKYVNFGYIQMLVLLCMTINYNIDIQMMKHYTNVSLSDIGIYGLGVALAEEVWLIPDAMKDILLSKLVKGKKEDEVARVIRINVFITLVCILGLILLGKPLILLLYGKAFEKAYFVLLLMMLGVTGMIYYKMVYSYNISQGYKMINLYLLGGTAVIHLLVNLLVIPLYGMWGALASTVVAYNFCGLAFMVYFHRKSKIPYKKLIFIQKKDIIDIKQNLVNN